MLGALWTGLLLVQNGTVMANSVETLLKVEDSLSKAQRQKKNLETTNQKMMRKFLSLQKRSILLAARSQNLEKNLLSLQTARNDLNNRIRNIKNKFSNKQAYITSIIAVLQRIAGNPPTALIMAPQSPLSYIRTALLIGNTFPTLEKQAQELRENLQNSIQLKKKLELTEKSLKIKKYKLDKQRKSLLAVLNRKAIVTDKLLLRKKKATERTTELSRKARSLRDLIATLSYERNARKQQPIPHTKNSESSLAKETYGQLPTTGMPVAGNLIAPFGKSGGPGQPAEGLSFRTTPGSFVIAPKSGSVVFSGKFEGLGELLILEHGNEHHLLLAGMDQINVKTGSNVIAGEPIAIMSQLKNSKPTLYVELRQNGKPINAIPWLTSRNNRKK